MRKKILIIDDEVDACQLMKGYLQKNYTIACAHTLKDGLEKLDELQPDVLFLDNNLPDGLGWAMAAKIQKFFPQMKIVLLSAFDMPPYPLTVGGPEFERLEKPIRLDILNSFID